MKDIPLAIKVFYNAILVQKATSQEFYKRVVTLFEYNMNWLFIALRVKTRLCHTQTVNREGIPLCCLSCLCSRCLG
jgi:hypothetical protein